MAKYKFIAKNGSVFERELCERCEMVTDTVPTDADRLENLARGIFDRRFLKEATIRGEGNSGRALDIMWSKTKPTERAAAIQEATEILAIRPEVGRFRWFREACVYVEVGTVFVDPATVAGRTPKVCQAKQEGPVQAKQQGPVRNPFDARQERLRAQRDVIAGLEQKLATELDAYELRISLQ